MRTRGLSEEERSRITLWFAKRRAWARAYGWFVGLTFLSWPATAGFFIWEEVARGNEIPFLHIVFAALAGYMMVGGLISGVAEIVMGISRFARWTLILLAVAIVTCAGIANGSDF